MPSHASPVCTACGAIDTLRWRRARTTKACLCNKCYRKHSDENRICAVCGSTETGYWYNAKPEGNQYGRFFCAKCHKTSCKEPEEGGPCASCNAAVAPAWKPRILAGSSRPLCYWCLKTSSVQMMTLDTFKQREEEEDGPEVEADGEEEYAEEEDPEAGAQMADIGEDSSSRGDTSNKDWGKEDQQRFAAPPEAAQQTPSAARKKREAPALTCEEEEASGTAKRMRQQAAGLVMAQNDFVEPENGSRPPDKLLGKGSIIPDIFGFSIPNTRLFADQLAQQGFFVLLPDIFHGNAWDDKVEIAPKGDWSQFMAWKDKHPQGPQLLRLDRLLIDMHQQYKPKSVSCIGFCWGGHHAVTLAGSDKVQAAIIAHGSFVTKELVQGAKQPIQFLFADNDPQIGEDLRKELEAILAKKQTPTNSKFYPGMHHGWVIRGDESDPKQQLMPLLRWWLS
ncbi:hypothetical protein WJX82_010544 [Trebouxia sp. C0006]